MNANKLLTLGEVSRRSNISEATGRRLRNRGWLVPDFMTSRESLFLPDRMPVLKALVKQAQA